MITQFIENLPEGKTHPDFTRKPIALTIQEGKSGSLKIYEYESQRISMKHQRQVEYL